MIFNLKIDSENDALAQNPPEELARIFRSLAEKIEQGETAGLLKDINGNTIGEWSYS